MKYPKVKRNNNEFDIVQITTYTMPNQKATQLVLYNIFFWCLIGKAFICNLSFIGRATKRNEEKKKVLVPYIYNYVKQTENPINTISVFVCKH